MKRILFAALFFFGAISLAACADFTKLNAVEYNNLVVTQVNETSLALETSANLYNETVPATVTEKTEIDASAMQTANSTAIDAVQKTEKLTELTSQNLEQETTVKEALTAYNVTANSYLAEYQVMLDYYDTSVYKEDISKVGEIDENLHGAYTTFIEANNDLVETLDGFVKK